MLIWRQMMPVGLTGTNLKISAEKATSPAAPTSTADQTATGQDNSQCDME